MMRATEITELEKVELQIWLCRQLIADQKQRLESVELRRQDATESGRLLHNLQGCLLTLRRLRRLIRAEVREKFLVSVIPAEKVDRQRNNGGYVGIESDVGLDTPNMR